MPRRAFWISTCIICWLRWNVCELDPMNKPTTPFTGDKWHLALVNADGGDFRYVKKATATNDSFWSSCWAPDGRSIYMQDLDNLHQIGLDGAEIKSWKLESLIPKGSFSSGSRFAVSPDGRQ